MTGYCFMGPFENSTAPSLVRDNPTGGDPIMLATLARIHRPDELHELCSLANSASSSENPTMTANQFRAAIERLGLSQQGAARLFDADPRTARRWALEERAIPETVAILLRLLLAGKITVEDIENAKRK